MTRHPTPVSSVPDATAGIARIETINEEVTNRYAPQDAIRTCSAGSCVCPPHERSVQDEPDSSQSKLAKASSSAQQPIWPCGAPESVCSQSHMRQASKGCTQRLPFQFTPHGDNGGSAGSAHVPGV